MTQTRIKSLMILSLSKGEEWARAMQAQIRVMIRRELHSAEGSCPIGSWHIVAKKLFIINRFERLKISQGSIPYNTVWTENPCPTSRPGGITATTATEGIRANETRGIRKRRDFCQA